MEDKGSNLQQTASLGTTGIFTGRSRRLPRRSGWLLPTGAGGGFGGSGFSVGLLMLAEMIATGKTLAAKETREFFLPRVGTDVPFQLVGTGEPFAAEKPVADEGTLARVPAQVGLQVGRFAVHLPASRNVAAMNWLSSGSSRTPQTLQLLAIRTIAGRTTP